MWGGGREENPQIEGKKDLREKGFEDWRGVVYRSEMRIVYPIFKELTNLTKPIRGSLSSNVEKPGRISNAELTNYQYLAP